MCGHYTHSERNYWVVIHKISPAWLRLINADRGIESPGVSSIEIILKSRKLISEISVPQRDSSTATIQLSVNSSRQLCVTDSDISDALIV